MPFTLPRKSAVAGGLVTLLSLGPLSVSAQPASAFAGSVAARAMGLSANVTLVGSSPVNVAPYSVANYPGGPADGTAVPLNVANVASTGVIATHVTGVPKDDTSTSSAQVDGLNLVSNLVTADTVGSTCTAGPTGASGSSSVTDLKGLGGLLTVPATITPNTVVPVALLGINIATVTLNEQVVDTTPGQYGITVRALHLRLLGGVLGAVGTGDIVVGESTCTTTVPSTPVVSSVSPISGPVAGGTTVTINGTDMLAVNSVAFGGVPAASFTRVSPTQVTAVTPAHTAGTVAVSVGNVGGTGSLASAFTFRNAPAVTAVSPASGPTGGGNAVTVTGTGFDDITGVTFGGTPATNVTRLSSTAITATAPAGTGTADVAVIGAGGTSANSPADNYGYVVAPTLGSITPASGRTTGGDTVTLTGTNFTPGTTVTVDGAQVTPTVQNSTTLTVTMPAHAAGDVPVVVSTVGGSAAPQTFSYLVYPVVTSLTPMWGPVAGGSTITVNGTHMAGVTSASVDGVIVPILNQTGTSVEITTPAHAAGAVSVTLAGPGAASVDAGTFTYVAPPAPSAPTVTSLSPDHAPTGGLVSVSGTGFTPGTTVTFGGTPAASVVVLDANTLLAGVPAGSGVVAVQVTTVDGTSTPGAASTFTYPPVLTSISPDNGPAAGGTVVTVTGSGFTPATVVLIDGVPVEPTYISPTQMTVVLPAHAAGDVSVAVQLNGVSSGTTTVRYLGAGSTGSTGSPTASPTTSPTSSPSSSATTSPTSDNSSTATSTATSSAVPTQDGSPDPTSGTDNESGNADTTDSAGNDGTAINGNTGGGGVFSGTGGRSRDGAASATAAASSRGSGAGRGTQAESGDGVTSDAETGVFSSAMHSKLGWGLFLLLLAALAAGWAIFGGAWRRRQEARRLADALERYWAGMGPAVASEAVAVIRIPRLGEDWRWPVYRMTNPGVLDHGVGLLRSGDLLDPHPGDAELAALASSPFHPLRHLPGVLAGDAITVITPQRIFTYRATGTGTGGALPSWGPPADEGSKFTLSTCKTGGVPEGAEGATLRAVLERINHRTMNSEAPAEPAAAE